jgi:hypothetical protein
MSEAELQQMDRVDDPPPPPEPEPQQAAPPDEDAAFDAELEKQAIDIPDGEKLVPLSAVTTVRGKLKEQRAAAEAAKTESANERSAREALEQQLRDAQPVLMAAQALLAQQQQQAPQPHGEQPDPLAERLAKLTDLYGQDGQPDAKRGKELAAVVRELASEIVKQEVAPIHQQTVQSQSSLMLQRALATKGPNGQQPAPEAIKAMWSKLDPSITSTVEGARWAWTLAMGTTAMSAAPDTRQRGADGKFVTQPPPDPLYTERAGGRVEATRTPLSEMERKIIKDLGMTESEYLKADDRPWKGRR